MAERHNLIKMSKRPPMLGQRKPALRELPHESQLSCFNMENSGKFFMAAAIGLRADHAAEDLRKLVTVMGKCTAHATAADLDTLRWLFIALALSGIALAVWARLDDWRKGLR